jgi:hypothetical protein
MDMQHGGDCESCEMGDKNKMMWKMKRREHRAIHALMAIIVVIFVFWCGFEFGEIRGSVGMGHTFGHRTMQSGFSGGNEMYNGGTMRQVIPQNTNMNAGTQTTNANSASTK